MSVFYKRLKYFSIFLKYEYKNSSLFPDAKYIQRKIQRRNQLLKGNRRELPGNRPKIPSVPSQRRPSNKPSKKPPNRTAKPPNAKPSNGRPPQNRPPPRLQREDKNTNQKPKGPGPTNGPGINTIRPTLEVITNPFSGVDKPFGPDSSEAQDQQNIRKPLKTNKKKENGLRHHHRPTHSGLRKPPKPSNGIRQHLSGLKETLTGPAKRLATLSGIIPPSSIKQPPRSKRKPPPSVISKPPSGKKKPHSESRKPPTDISIESQHVQKSPQSPPSSTNQPPRNRPSNEPLSTVPHLSPKKPLNDNGRDKPVFIAPWEKEPSQKPHTRLAQITFLQQKNAPVKTIEFFITI